MRLRVLVLSLLCLCLGGCGALQSLTPSLYSGVSGLFIPKKNLDQAKKGFSGDNQAQNFQSGMVKEALWQSSQMLGGMDLSYQLDPAGNILRDMQQMKDNERMIKQMEADYNRQIMEQQAEALRRSRMLSPHHTPAVQPATMPTTLPRVSVTP